MATLGISFYTLTSVPYGLARATLVRDVSFMLVRSQIQVGAGHSDSILPENKWTHQTSMLDIDNLRHFYNSKKMNDVSVLIDTRKADRTITDVSIVIRGNRMPVRELNSSYGIFMQYMKLVTVLVATVSAVFLIIRDNRSILHSNRKIVFLTVAYVFLLFFFLETVINIGSPRIVTEMFGQ